LFLLYIAVIFCPYNRKMASRSHKNMRSRRNKNSRRNKSRSSRRRQRGGVVLAPGAANGPYTLLPESALNALKQGAQYQMQHLGQHGGAALVGTTGVLPSGMMGAAMQDKLMVSLNEAALQQDGGRRRRRRASRKASKKSKKSRKTSKKASRKARKSRRRQRGGQAPANASYMTGVDAKDTHPQFKDFTSF
jgi:hypothetical protein